MELKDEWFRPAACRPEPLPGLNSNNLKISSKNRPKHQNFSRKDFIDSIEKNVTAISCHPVFVLYCRFVCNKETSRLQMLSISSIKNLALLKTLTRLVNSVAFKPRFQRSF